MELAAVAQDHHKKAESAAGIAHADTTGRAPVGLGALARGEGQSEEVRRARGPD